MKKDLTEIILIIDRSASMKSIHQVLEKELEEYIDTQRKFPGECRVTLTQFNSVYEILYSGKDIKDVEPIQVDPDGMTALLDAIAKTIINVGDRLSKTDESERPEKVLVLVFTDGEENSSSDYSARNGGTEKVKQLIEHQRTKYGWEFIFMGAGQDAVLAAQKMGMGMGVNFTADAAGTSDVMRGMNYGTSNYRGGHGYVTTDPGDVKK